MSDGQSSLLTNKEEFLSALNAKSKFPKHGWSEDSKGCVYLIFPIFRAIWERTDLDSDISWSWNDFNRMHHFQRMSFKIMKVLSKIARAETLILSGKGTDGVTIEEWAPEGEAETFLPIWIDSFYIYFRMLADSLAVTLGSLISDAPRSFPRFYKDLLGAAERNELPEHWQVKVTVNTPSFLRALKDNSDWYVKLVGPIEGDKKGIRDTIEHRPVTTKLIREIDDTNRTKRIRVQFNAWNGDVPKIDIFSTIPEIIHGFCNLLSSLPVELWIKQNFHVGDITFRGEKGWQTVTNYFPKVL